VQRATTQDARALNGKNGTTTAILGKRPPRSTNTYHLRNGVSGIPLACRSNRSIPKFTFQLSNASGQSWLCKSEMLRSGAKAAAIGNRNNVANLFQLH